MGSLLRETRLFLSSRTGVLLIAALFALTTLSVALGLQHVAGQQAAFERVRALQAEDLEAVTHHAASPGDAAYYTFHLVEKTPAPMAFAALGQSDVSPSVLRIRALALEGQIHENESGNPELALPGRFDFAFVLVYLAPLVLIALLHDTWSGEREAGRFALLSASPKSATRLWAPRVCVRAGLVLLALLAPLAGAGVANGAAPTDIAIASALTAAMVAFWTLVSVWVASRSGGSSVHAASLAAIWFAVTLVAPASANLAINALTPLPDGAQIARENREAVHDGWDIPKDDTLTRFFALYPEWKDTAPITTSFHWKWYFAFQHLGDVHVASESAAYRAGIAQREMRAQAVSWVLPPIAIQRALHRLADTDVDAQLAWQDKVRSFHHDLRAFYYPYLFEERGFSADDFAKAPRFDAVSTRAH